MLDQFETGSVGVEDEERDGVKFRVSGAGRFEATASQFLETRSNRIGVFDAERKVGQAPLVHRSCRGFALKSRRIEVQKFEASAVALQVDGAKFHPLKFEQSVHGGAFDREQARFAKPQALAVEAARASEVGDAKADVTPALNGHRAFPEQRERGNPPLGGSVIGSILQLTVRQIVPPSAVARRPA